jgi:hypothetical protein
VGGEWSASRPGRFTSGETAPGTHWIGDWVSPRDRLDDVEKRKFLTVLGLEPRTHCRPAHSQSLYRLRYNSLNVFIIFLNVGSRNRAVLGHYLQGLKHVTCLDKYICHSRDFTVRFLGITEHLRLRTVVRDVTPCSLVDYYRRLVGTCCLEDEGTRFFADHY